jgi:hypothetical protein
MEEVGYFVPFDLFFNDQFDKKKNPLREEVLDRAPPHQ